MSATQLPDDARDLILLVGANVRRARKEQKLTQEELATHIDTSRITVSTLERGQRETIDPVLLSRLATALNRPISSFFSTGTIVVDAQQQNTSSQLSPQINIVLQKFERLPQNEQERVGRLLEHVVLWYESERAIS